MQIEFQNSKEDFVDYFKTILEDRFKNSILYFLVMTAFLLYFVYSGNYNWYISVGIVIAFLSSITTSFYFFPLWKFAKKFNQSIKTKPNFAEKRIVTLSEHGIKIEGKESETLIISTWEDVKDVKEKGKFILISTANKQNLLLSERWFSSNEEKSNFIKFTLSKITYTQPIKDSKYSFENKSTYSKYSPATFGQKKPPYLLGLLCIIPLVGAFVGAGLLLYGIFVYKDKWIITIGVAGILFTAFVFKSMSPSTNDPQFNKGMTELDKGQLNGLIKSIEFYKIQNGNYPDSLQQLDLKGEAISISDPLLMFKGDKTAIFNYHKIGKKYTLFSSGIDKTPNTADDIYPSLQIDTTKIGLIINRR